MSQHLPYQMRIFILTALGAVLAAPLCAQDSSRAPRHYPTPPAAPASEVHSEYDPQYDKTVLQLDLVPLDRSVGISALVALDGREVRKEADGVVVTIWSVASEKRYQQDRHISLSIDGAASVDLGQAYLQPNPRRGFTEVLMKSFSLDQWLQLAAARSAKLGIGETTYELSPQLLTAIRTFASRMEPKS